jgi:hypothetical protein
MPRHISLFDVVFNRVCCFVLFRILFRVWILICGCARRGLLSRGAAQTGPAWPSLARPGLGPRATSALPLSMPRPLPWSLSPHSILPRTTPSLSHLSLSPVVP